MPGPFDHLIQRVKDALHVPASAPPKHDPRLDADVGAIMHDLPRVDPSTPIGMRWKELGGGAIPGAPETNEITLADGGKLQVFANGAIFWSRAFGAVFVTRPIYDKWASPSVASTKTAAGDTVQDTLGYPIADSFHTGEGGQAAYLERGAIVARAGGGVFAIYGAIYGHYRELGDLAGQVPVIGLPSSDEQAAPNGGRVSHCDGGDMYWHAATGAFEVHGAIRDRWLALGGATSNLGYPNTDELPVIKGSTEIGRMNQFQGGEIWWSPRTPAVEVYGAILDAWRKAGGARGALGFPITGETDTPASGGRYNEFEHGIVVWHGAGPLAGAFPVLALDLYVDSVQYNGHYKVQVNLTASNGAQNHGEWGEFDGHHDMQQSVLGPFDPVRANLVIDVWLNGISPNLIGKDDRIGQIVRHYTIDDLWGLLDPTDPQQADQFVATFRCRPLGPPIPDNDGEFRRKLFWPFVNFSTGQLSWEEYSGTFRDVVEHDKQVSLNPLDFRVHPWEITFYEFVYRSLGQGGNCFGMCLESLYARTHHSMFMEPLFDSPFNSYRKTATKPDPNDPKDAGVVEEVNVKHGYQVGAGMVGWFLDAWTSGSLHDPVRAFRESRDAYRRGDYPLLTVSDKDKFSQSGHAVVPYAWFGDDNDPNHQFRWTIKVANPNFPDKGDDYDGNNIYIDPHANSFRFAFGENDTWTGDSESGGRLAAIPFSLLSYQPVLPGTNVLAMLAGGVILIVAGAGTRQITDGRGRTFFTKPRLAADEAAAASSARIGGHPVATHAFLEQARPNLDPNTRIDDLMLVAIHDGVRVPLDTGKIDFAGLVPAAMPEVWYLRRDPPNAMRPAAPVSTSPANAPAPTATPAAPQPGTADGPPHRYALNVHDVLERGAGGVVGGAAGILGSWALTHEIDAQPGQAYRWSIYAPRMSASVQTTAGDGAEAIHIDRVGHADQAVSVALPQGAAPKTVHMAVSGWWDGPAREAPWFELRDVQLQAGQKITAAINDRGRELILANEGPATTFTLNLRIGMDPATISERPGVALEAGAQAVIRPDDWTPANLGTTPVQMRLQGPGGAVVRTL